MPERPTALRRPWRFPLLCGVGTAVVVLGVLVPRWVAPAGETAETTAGPDLTPLLTRFAVTTVVVLAACAATTRVAGRRFRPPPIEPGGPTFEVLEAVPVGGRCCVHLVRAGDELLLAGVDATGLKSLLHLSSDAEPSPTIGLRTEYSVPDTE